MPCSNAGAGVPASITPHRPGLWLAALTASLLLTGASVAAPEEPRAPVETDPEQKQSTIDTVEVTARRESLRKTVASFVANITRADGESVARWRQPICPWIAGAAPEQAKFIKSRVGEISRSVGVRVNASAKCKLNLLVFLTTEPGKLQALLRERSPRTFGTASSREAAEFFDTTRPVRIWRNSLVVNAAGDSPITDTNKPPQYRLKDSRILSSVAEDIAVVIVVVDTNATGAATFGQLADYVTMVALAKVDMNAELGNSPTILRLFANDSRENIPRRMTDWDHAFLKALYGMRAQFQQQRNAIATRMVQDLVPSNEVRAGE